VPPSPSRRCVLLLGCLTVGLAPGSARDGSAQTPRAPDAGGRTVSLGQPLRWHWQAGLAAGTYFEGPSNDLIARAEAGVYHAPLNPVTKLLELGMEAYAGVLGSKADGGVRGILQVPYLSGGLGADYNLRSGRLDMLVTLHTPVRRGGLLAPGTLLRVNWYPTLRHSVTLGVSFPLGDRLAGRNRPIQDYVVVARDFHTPASHRAGTAALDAALDSLRVSAEWIRRLVVPFLDQDGRDGGIALARTARYVAELKARLAVRSVAEEVRFFHTQLEQLFALASGSAAGGRDLARRCREILLDDVVLPYDRLLGRKKRNDTLKELAMSARGRFGRSVATSPLVPSTRAEAVLFVFERLTDILETERRQAAKEWDDPRLVWLPLQYALLPDEYDEQSELDALVERATGVGFTDHNRVSYVANLQFHWELLRMIHEARDYHVLWIHDFPASTPAQTLDWGAFDQVVDGYLAALAERVEAYDSTAQLPSYFVFVDQHYYEQRKSRVLMTVLEDPLHASARLPLGTARDAERLAGALERLRLAVRHSRVLQAEAREYGDAWLRNRIKVHVNVTNRVDASFWSGGLISSVFGYPDDVMRDHRKMAFRDVSEDDPFSGEAVITGMGVGQQYLGPGWDDRSLILRGPVVLQLKQAAHDLLLSQGLVEQDIPPPLRSRPAADGALARLATRPDAARFEGRAMALVNGTGYLPKPLNVGKAVLYSLMPPGSVIKVPDSLWNATFYAGLLVGACLRGAEVFIIAPALANAPSSGFPQMARAHELLTRLLLVRRELADAIAAAGGALHTGLYALPGDARGFASRADLWARQVSTTPFLQALLPFAPALVPIVADAGRGAPGVAAPSPDASLQPKLHQKVQFLATQDFWRAVTAAPEWPGFMATYLRYRQATYAPDREYADARALPDSLELIADRIRAHLRDVPKAASFAIVGSQNQDYRGMFMDGEVGVLFTGPQSLVPLIDLVFMVGTVTWVDDQATLDRLLPPVGELQRRIARIAKDGV
jgi:phosphatidylserine/phosphatidylglycerophosphate/cardiolipin synthase-like enzyme